VNTAPAFRQIVNYVNKKVYDVSLRKKREGLNESRLEIWQLIQKCNNPFWRTISFEKSGTNTIKLFLPNFHSPSSIDTPWTLELRIVGPFFYHCANMAHHIIVKVFLVMISILVPGLIPLDFRIVPWVFLCYQCTKLELLNLGLWGQFSTIVPTWHTILL